MTVNETAQTPAIAPTRKQVDALILEHAAAQAELISGGAIKKAAGESAAELQVRLKAWQTTAAEARAKATVTADEIEQRLVAMVTAHGTKHAEKSMRIEGEHNRATVTRGTRVATRTEGVDNFKAYLDKSEIPGISGLFFTEHVSYSLVAGPAEVLKTLTLGKKIREKVTSLIGLCFEIKTNAPSLKVEAVAAAKPTAKAA